ncbi:import inner membrane translocase subunit Tim44 [Gluconacetobacter diazotrophicus PA1 5]|nr:Tim44/TimA family putative adaptor protein [Gluconacetobacter diazotrophicus]ACI50085.1 import inner membrane translocase subunit Tim44 [Gluconacetobacter diazotrophicus PA1 5]TWB07835.1 putative lipid-binding transport protein (Tim44 family) [Gluconacetobacter diazotrophicus]
MDFSFSHFPFDLVLFGLVAAFLALRLRSILGTRVGVEPAPPPSAVPRPGPVIEGRAEPPATLTDYDVPAPETRVGQVLAAIAQQERDFVPAQFLKGVEAAFRQIVLAFAAGDVAMLRERLTANAFSAFEAAIRSREQSGEIQKAEVRAIASLAIVDAAIEERDGATHARIDVRIVSDQISLTSDKDGHPVAGTDAVTEFSDLWTFERPLGVAISGAAWRLAASRSA